MISTVIYYNWNMVWRLKQLWYCHLLHRWVQSVSYLLVLLYPRIGRRGLLEPDSWIPLISYVIIRVYYYNYCTEAKTLFVCYCRVAFSPVYTVFQLKRFPASAVEVWFLSGTPGGAACFSLAFCPVALPGSNVYNWQRRLENCFTW